MSVEDAIREFVVACERFQMALSDERRFESRLTEDSQESSFQRLLDMQRERCGIRNEIEALSQAVIASLTAQNMPDAALSVSRVVVASWNNVGRWNDVWFECKSQLTTATIVAGREPLADAGWSGWYPPGDWWKTFPKSPSWCRSQMDKWLTEKTVQRKGERGDIRFQLSFLKELDLEPPS